MLDANIEEDKSVNESILDEKMKALATKEEIKKLATKTELNAEQDKIIKIQTFDLSCFCGKSHFECDDIQNYIVF